jgi:uncharacterized membrane protein YgdD (TMEM256/DUF423 family)
MRDMNQNKMLSASLWLQVFAWIGFLSVALGAFGAHALKKSLSPEEMQIFETGAKYQFYHCLAGILVAILSIILQEEKFLKTCAFFLSGIFFFSGSLYILCITHVKTWGMITPIGGTLFLIGWAWFAFSLRKHYESQKL